MPQHYKVIQISPEQPRKWDGPHGAVYYIDVMLEGHAKPVSIGKKSPDALKAGATVYGDIEESDFVADKFKAAKEFNQTGTTASESVDTQESIWRSVALNNATALQAARVSNNTDNTATNDAHYVLEIAEILYAWLAQKPSEQPKKADWPAVQQSPLKGMTDTEWQLQQAQEQWPTQPPAGMFEDDDPDLPDPTNRWGIQ